MLLRTTNQHYTNEPRFDLQRTGVGKINDLDDYTVKYESTVCKEQSQFKEAVLHMMYAYRKERFVMAMLTMTEGLMHAIANCDRSNSILRYLLTCEPPSYICRRYWDWIEPHIIEHIQNCSDNVHIMHNREEMEIALRVLQLLEKIKEQNKDLIARTDGMAGRQMPDPYLVWDIIGSNEFDNKRTEDDMVHVVQHELLANVSPSRPTGSGNDSIHKVWSGHRVAFVPKRIKVRRKKPRKWVRQTKP